MTKVLVAYDGSDASRSAIEDLTRARLPADADALVLAVGEVWLPSPSSYGLVDTDTVEHAVLIREATELARDGEQRVRAFFPGWSVRAESHSGSPARSIVERAQEWRPDLIALGSHGRTGLARLFLGSVSQRVATEAPCSVEVIRPRA